MFYSIHPFLFRNHDNIVMYRGKSKHFFQSIVNSILGLTYIVLMSPKGIYDIVKIREYFNMAERNKTTELILHVISTMVVISNPLIYSFLTPK